MTANLPHTNQNTKANQIPRPEIANLTLTEYVKNYQVDGVLWLAEQLLGNLDNAILRSDRVSEIAEVIASIPSSQQVRKDDYIQQISKTYSINKRTLEKLVADHTEIDHKKSKLTKTIQKNASTELEGNEKVFPFFVELTDAESGDLKKIKIDLVKYVQLLSHFGFTRYATDSDTVEGYTFIRLRENVMKEVMPEEIKDFIETFIREQYDFDAAGCAHVDADKLINVFYDNLDKYFSKKLFARVRNANPIVINQDTATECFLYYSNGFVRVTKDSCELESYSTLKGCVWQKQMLTRDFKRIDLQMITGEDGVANLSETFTADFPLGIFADFVWRVCGQRAQRFASLCSILGYLMHDFYDYKLKCILLTDSTISENSEGRTGKTLVMQMLSFCRSYCEINGKQFDSADERKYQMADRSTQILHINDVSHKGKNKFDFESLFNDITEGFFVRNLYKSPFRQRSKIVVSSNRTLKIDGASARDRIVEFEMSNFFGEDRNPLQYYGSWMGKGWNEEEFNKFDNFICFCVQVFLKEGLVQPESINLEARKLQDGTCLEFIEFMDDITDNIKAAGSPWAGYQNTAQVRPNTETIADFEFDKKKLFERFVTLYPDYKSHLTNRGFTKFLLTYSKLRPGISDPFQRRSHGESYIQFVSNPN